LSCNPSQWALQYFSPFPIEQLHAGFLHLSSFSVIESISLFGLKRPHRDLDAGKQLAGDLICKELEIEERSLQTTA